MQGLPGKGKEWAGAGGKGRHTEFGRTIEAGISNLLIKNTTKNKPAAQH